MPEWAKQDESTGSRVKPDFFPCPDCHRTTTCECRVVAYLIGFQAVQLSPACDVCATRSRLSAGAALYSAWETARNARWSPVTTRASRS
jgi:hypothetical protein